MVKKAVAVAVTLIAILAVVVAYLMANRPASQATLYVDPRVISRPVGQNFTINVSILDVSDLYGWRLKLKWNATILNVTNVAEGSFLNSSGNTFFFPKINDTAGYIVLDCTFLGNISGISGDGALATIRFYVKENGSCDLDLYDTTLLDSSVQHITHTVKDGRFNK